LAEGFGRGFRGVGRCSLLIFGYCTKLLGADVAGDVGFREGSFQRWSDGLGVLCYGSSNRRCDFVAGCVRCADVQNSPRGCKQLMEEIDRICPYFPFPLVSLIALSIASSTSGRTISRCPRNSIFAPYLSRSSPCCAS
jgi:hypothetical protein